ncbi:DNA polymerase III, beta subunit [Neorhizobium galegae bv. officinalis]|nr:DNA polymerase III, beta subunit [Neorhizobium galegae bv. officinalis]
MFIASKTALLDALKLVGQIVERRNTIPILSNVLFERGESGRLTARVSDLDLEAVIPFSADVETVFRPFTVPAHMLSDIVRKLPDGADIHVTAADDCLQAIMVKAGRSKFRLQVLPPDDFPSMAIGELPFSLEVPVPALARALAAVGFAISTEETRYYLNGIFFHPAEGGIKLVATDGHRLSKRFISVEDAPQNMPGIIVPKKTVETIAKHLPKEGLMQLQVSDAKIRMVIGDIVLLSKLIDGTFPDYVRVIPSHSGFVEIEGKPFAAAIDRVSTVSSGSRAVKMTFAAGTLKLAVNNPDAGNAEDEVSFEGDAEVETGFNAKYVTDALNHLSEGTIHFHLGDAGSPAVLRSDGDHIEDLIVLMPMRV